MKNLLLKIHLKKIDCLNTERLIEGTDEIDTGYANTFMFLFKESAAKRKNDIIDKIIELNQKEAISM